MEQFSYLSVTKANSVVGTTLHLSCPIFCFARLSVSGADHLRDIIHSDPVSLKLQVPFTHSLLKTSGLHLFEVPEGLDIYDSVG